jgi:hypothetical protein
MPVKLSERVRPDLPTAAAAIKEMHAYYKQDMRENDATSAWVTIAEIEALIKDNTINGIVPNGIRILYGRHKLSTEAALKFEYKDKHNVILIATHDPSLDTPKTETSKNLLTEEHFVSFSAPYSGMGDDSIPLCPPRCP